MRISDESMLKLNNFVEYEGSETGEVVGALLDLESMSSYISNRLYNHVIDELNEWINYIDNNVLYIKETIQMEHINVVTRDEVNNTTWEELKKQSK